MNGGGEDRSTITRGSYLFPVLLSVILTSVHTWPLVLNPAHFSSNDNADAQLNEWILAWIAHALPRSPLHLFQANIFYPASDALAFSEPLIVPGVLGAPVAWLGGSPVLVFNLMLLAGLALTVCAGYALMFAWTRDRMAALLAASTFAFNTHTLTRLAHTQAIHLYGLPLALLVLDRLVTTRRTRGAWLLAISFIALAYTSGYLLVLGAVMIGVATLVRAPEWLARSRGFVQRLALAAAVAVVAILPLSLPYQRAAQEQGMVRSLDAVTEYSASLAGYLASSGRLHLSTWSGAFFRDPVNSFFPGIIVAALAVLALWRAVRSGGTIDSLTRRRTVMLGAIAVTGFVLSLGTHTPVYGWLYSIFPPMHGLRVAARFGNLFLLGMSCLAGFGLTYVRRGLSTQPRSRRYAVLMASLLVIAAQAEALRAPIAYRRFTGIPRLYTLLAAEPNVVLAEMPFYPRQGIFENAEYVLNSTAHWRPLMNGYSGYTPRSYVKFADTFWFFPRDYAIDAIRRAGVTHVMVHPERFGRDADDVIKQMETRPDFELMGIGARGLRLYRLR